MGSATSHFGARDRLYTNKTPILTCPSNDDLFTMTGATKGNGKLTYPIGLITADEVAMGGLVSETVPSVRNVNMYDTGVAYWTISPYHTWASSRWYECLWGVWKEGKLSFWYLNYEIIGARPVINLIKEITFSKGDGTSTNPFEIGDFSN